MKMQKNGKKWYFLISQENIFLFFSLVRVPFNCNTLQQYFGHPWFTSLTSPIASLFLDELFHTRILFISKGFI